MTEAVAEKTMREKIEALVESLPADQVTLSLVVDRIGHEGWLLFCVFLTLPFMVPISIPGVSTVFGAMIFLIGTSLALNRNPWLPARLMNRRFSSVKLKAALLRGDVWLKRLERITHPRLPRLTQGYLADRMNGLMLVLGALLLMAPWGTIPLTNTLPGLAVLFLAVGILQKDGACILLGYLTNLVTIIYFAVLVFVFWEVITAAIYKCLAWFH